MERITTLKKHQKVTRNAFDQLLPCKRSIIETINDPLKNISAVDHTRIIFTGITYPFNKIVRAWQEKY